MAIRPQSTGECVNSIFNWLVQCAAGSGNLVLPAVLRAVLTAVLRAVLTAALTAVLAAVLTAVLTAVWTAVLTAVLTAVWTAVLTAGSGKLVLATVYSEICWFVIVV